MLLLLILAMTLVAFVADGICLFRLRRQSLSRRILFAVWAFATDALPIAIVIGNGLIHDNSTAYMAASMWVFWLWLVTVTPRLAFYFFFLVRLPRVGIVVGTGIVLIFVWGATWGRTRLHVTRIEVCSERLPDAFDGLRIVQLSDIHLGTMVRPEPELQRIVDSVEALRPDVVIFTGDLVNVRVSEISEGAARILSSLKAPYGVFSVTGNHDSGAYIMDTVSLPRAVSYAQVVDRQREIGWNVLEDSTVYLVRGKDSISLSGIAYDMELGQRRHDRQLPPAKLDVVYRNVPDSLFNITAVHLPQLWEQIVDTQYGDLTLAGHVHSMQLKVKLLDKSYSPASRVYKEWSGRYEQQGKALYINDGTGYVAYPMRLGAWPEITLITLRRCE